MTIHEEYQLAGKLHGHYCPGLAIGVRAAVEARIALDDGNVGKGLCVIAERSACWLDGMCLIGATIGNGKLKLRDTGKAAFSFYNTESGKSVRFVLKSGPEGLTRDRKTEWLLTAPVEEVFDMVPVKVPFPEYQPGPGDVICSVCGEAETRTIEKAAHKIVIDTSVTPTCTETGVTEGQHCSVCGEVLVEQQTIAAAGHNDNNSDGICDSCGENLGTHTPSENCSCSCHKKGIANFFFKIALFFQKLFKKNQVCKCGAWHY